jgi:hypothetical protein
MPVNDEIASFYQALEYLCQFTSMISTIITNLFIQMQKNITHYIGKSI